jgi:hypothetical protein
MERLWTVRILTSAQLFEQLLGVVMRILCWPFFIMVQM